MSTDPITSRFLRIVSCLLIACASAAAEPEYPPSFPGGADVVSFSSDDLLIPPEHLREDITIADTPPKVDVLYYPGQDYAGNPWSVWGDGLVVGDVYYSSIGDHKGPDGNAFVYKYDSRTQKLERIVDVRRLLDVPDGHYTPGKIHSRIDMGGDGWLYFSTHRGSTRVTTPEFHYTGDWILRHHPKTGQTEIVAHAPLPMQCLPTSVLDPERMIFYAGTADGDRQRRRVQFLAYDIDARRVLYSDDFGPRRAAIFAASTGRVYFHPGSERGAVENLVRFDPLAPGPPMSIDASVGLRAATRESRQGIVYTIDGDAIWEFDTRRESAELMGETAVGNESYIATVDMDPKTQRYLYYVPGAHGGGWRDNAPLVQYDVHTGSRKVIAFLFPACFDRTGYITMGTYGLAVSDDGATVFITWNGHQGTDRENITRRTRFNTCALTVIRIPESERQP